MASSGIQRIAGGEMAVAMLVFEWACEVVTPNFMSDYLKSADLKSKDLKSADLKEYGNPVSPVTMG